MNCYIISYDLNRGSDFDYSRLHDAIKAYGTWAHINKSVWAVVTSQSAAEVRGSLMERMDSGDSIFVVKSGVEAAWSNVICRNKWLQDNL